MILYSIISNFALFFLSYYKSYGIVKKNYKWFINNLFALFFSLTISIAPLLYYNNNLKYQASCILGILTFIGFVSLVTDIKYRLVNRHLLRLGFVLCIFPVLQSLFKYPLNKSEWIFYVIFLLVSISLFFFSKIGASDVRAIVIIAFSIFPVFGFTVIKIGVYIYAVLVILNGIILAVKNKKLKVSIPAVPVIVFSIVLSILFYCIIC